MNAVVQLPKGTDKTVGLLGTANGNAFDEWTTMDGTVLPFDRAQAVKKGGYDFCTKHFCIRQQEKSLFTYMEDGVDFRDYQKCDLPYGNTFDKYLVGTPKWILDLCGPDIACIIDATEGGEDAAIELRQTASLSSKLCNPSGGNCDQVKCCGASKCVDYEGFLGKVCDGDMTVCITFFCALCTVRVPGPNHRFVLIDENTSAPRNSVIVRKLPVVKGYSVPS